MFISAESALAPDKRETVTQRLAAAVKCTKGKHVLIVAESAGMAAKGAAINLYLEENNIKFEINPACAKEAGLQIRSGLMRLGKIVAPGEK